ncbi:hypothetical protein THIOSC15_1980030 [uncultured Thiomicrorhabdus sp.]
MPQQAIHSQQFKTALPCWLSLIHLKASAEQQNVVPKSQLPMLSAAQQNQQTQNAAVQNRLIQNAVPLSAEQANSSINLS